MTDLKNDYFIPLIEADGVILYAVTPQSLPWEDLPPPSGPPPPPSHYVVPLGTYPVPGSMT